MSIPTINDVQPVDPILTNLAIGYMQADSRFVASRAFPGVPVDKDSGTYFVFDKKYWFMNEMQRRAPGTPYARGGFGLSTDTYLTEQWALSNPIPDEVRANSQTPLDLESVAIKWLAQQSLIRKEISFGTDFMKVGVWGTDDNNSATDWDDFANGDPIANIRTAKSTISRNTGFAGNALVCGLIVADALEVHPDILDRIKYVKEGTEANMKAAIAAALGLSYYLVSEASYNSANESANASMAAIIDDDALVCYINPSAGVFDATAGKTFHWAPGGGLGGVRPIVRDDKADADLVKYKEQWDQKACATDLGYFFADIV